MLPYYQDPEFLAKLRAMQTPAQVSGPFSATQAAVAQRYANINRNATDLGLRRAQADAGYRASLFNTGLANQGYEAEIARRANAVTADAAMRFRQDEAARRRSADRKARRRALLVQGVQTVAQSAPMLFL